MIRYGSICSGIEAASVASAPLGWTPVFLAEIDPFCCALLDRRFPEAPNLGDMAASDFIDRARDLGPIDVLVAGTPCQAFSVAGQRQSLQDERGNRTLLLTEIADALEPAWIVWENVPGVLNTDDNAFGCFLAGLVGHPEPLPPGGGAPIGRWGNAGLVTGPRRAVAWRIFDAQYFGLAQRRRRVLLVGRRAGDGSDTAAVLFEPESLPGDPPPRRQTGEKVARCLTASPGGCSGKRTFVSGNGQPLNGLEGDQDTFTTGTLTASYADQSGNAIAMVNGLLAHSLTASHGVGEDGTGRATPIIPFDTTQMTSPHNRSNPRPGDPCHPIAASGHAPAIADTISVRRLAPRECERLQGFPDDWTRIPYRGRPPEQCPDTPRYKALGNSMPVPVMRWIFARIDTLNRGRSTRR